MTDSGFVPRRVTRTDHMTRYAWPTEMGLQGGKSGVVENPAVPDSPVFTTRFVEAWLPGVTFLRGEGGSFEEAEDRVWARYMRMRSCPAAPGHGPFDAKGYANGAGFCTRCGTWFVSAVTGLPNLQPPMTEAQKAKLAELEAFVKDPANDRAIGAALGDVLTNLVGPGKDPSK